MTVRPRLLAGLVGAAMAVGVGGSTLSLVGQQEESFPHEAHQGLFPLCTGCHQGVPVGDDADYYPEPESCSGCHDGVREEPVSWPGPSERVDNVVFEHAEHAAELAADGDPPQQCAACHIPAGGGRMAVADAVQLGTCWGCHAHEATDHQVDARCSVCHVPLSETAFELARIEALPVPADHDAGAFLDEEHGLRVQEDAGRCATCHTRERCVACHVDADREAIASFPAAPAGMELPAATAHYNEPTTHLEGQWLSVHGFEASRDACATCHTSDDCVSCHVQPAPAAIATLPTRAQVVAPGVRTRAVAPDSHDSFFFIDAHSTLAAADEVSCSTCHVESFCTDCHDGPVGGGYHPAGFVSRHAADAFGRDAECSNCHSTEAFCRECHLETGLASFGRRGPGYHDDGPLWLLRHPQAARQNLESCASCHRQVDCTRCHGVLGAFKVSPHSPSFDAARAWARSPRACLNCHIGNPLNGNVP